MRSQSIPEHMELIFEIRGAEEGGFYARALRHSIFTEGDTWEELRTNVSQPVPVHYVRDELIPVEAASERSRHIFLPTISIAVQIALVIAWFGKYLKR
jgi:hypothetical protein